MTSTLHSQCRGPGFPDSWSGAGTHATNKTHSQINKLRKEKKSLSLLRALSVEKIREMPVNKSMTHKTSVLLNHKT